MTPNEQYIEKQKELIAFLDDCNFSYKVTKAQWKKRKQLYDELAVIEKKLVPEMTDEEIANKAMELCPKHKNIVDGRPIPAAITDGCFIQGAKFYRDRNK